MISYVKGAYGIIQAVNPANYTATVKLHEYENRITGYLPILTPLSYKNKEVHVPAVGTPVFCIFLDDDTKKGLIIGCHFSEKNPSESEEGTYVLDFQNSTLKISEGGTVDITANKTTISSDVEITKTLKVTGAVNISDTLNVEKTIDAKGIIASEEVVKGKEFIKI